MDGGIRWKMGVLRVRGLIRGAGGRGLREGKSVSVLQHLGDQHEGVVGWRREHKMEDGSVRSKGVDKGGKGGGEGQGRNICECPAASWKPASNGWWDDREGRGKGGWGRVIMEGGIRWKIGVLGRSKGVDKEGGGGAGKEHL